jgi:hypothetical protein
MNTLAKRVQSTHARTSPAIRAAVDDLEEALGVTLSRDYRSFLETFGRINHGAYETYGLGVPEDHYLNVQAAYADLSRYRGYPLAAVPLLDVGDGRYYLYDNEKRQVLLWASPNGGIVETLADDLETFLAKKIFGQAD